MALGQHKLKRQRTKKQPVDKSACSRSTAAASLLSSGAQTLNSGIDGQSFELPASERQSATCSSWTKQASSASESAMRACWLACSCGRCSQADSISKEFIFDPGAGDARTADARTADARTADAIAADEQQQQQQQQQPKQTAQTQTQTAKRPTKPRMRRRPAAAARVIDVVAPAGYPSVKLIKVWPKQQQLRSRPRLRKQQQQQQPQVAQRGRRLRLLKSATVSAVAERQLRARQLIWPQRVSATKILRRHHAADSQLAEIIEQQPCLQAAVSSSSNSNSSNSNSGSALLALCCPQQWLHASPATETAQQLHLSRLSLAKKLQSRQLRLAATSAQPADSCCAQFCLNSTSFAVEQLGASACGQSKPMSSAHLQQLIADALNSNNGNNALNSNNGNNRSGSSAQQETEAAEAEAAAAAADGSSDRTGWEYVYVQRVGSAPELVKVEDTKDNCSDVSTILSTDNHKIPIRLAVSAELVAEGASVVMAGSAVQLGDWDVVNAERLRQMEAPADAALAEKYKFFCSWVQLTVNCEDDRKFRFVIVGAGAAVTEPQEIVCWEAGFLRRLDETSEEAVSRDLGFYVFGRPSIRRSLDELLGHAEEDNRNLNLAPGWPIHASQATVRITTSIPQLEGGLRRVGQEELTVELLLVGRDGKSLVPAFSGRCPLAPGAKLIGRNCATFAAKCIGQVEFVHTAPAHSTYCIRIRIGSSANCLSSVATCSQQLLQQNDWLAWPLALTNQEQPLPTGSSRLAGRLPVLISATGCVPISDSALLQSVDHFGLRQQPPTRPIQICPVPTLRLSDIVETGRHQFLCLRLVLGDAYFLELANLGKSVKQQLAPQATQLDELAEWLDTLPNSVSLLTFVDRKPSLSPESAADAALAPLLQLNASSWHLVIGSEITLCIKLALKQVRLPVAYAFAPEAPECELMTAMRLCNYFGIRAFVLPLHFADAAVLAAAKQNDLVVYTFGCSAAAAAQLQPLIEGVFI